ncbi:tryptophan 2,3-dioxygenase family protein [Flavobacteriales bacterium]|nr:tryptophan 2,3-dioxygenase family protein [Flavobacteriales bacterium]
MELDEEIKDRIEKLQDKYATMGQDMKSYLDGLLYSDPLNYWDYIHTDTLLSLQTPRTDFPDEQIFIMYHQITELYFKLSLLEMEQIAGNGKIVEKNGEFKGWKDTLDVTFFIERVNRINRYFEALTNSFEIMVQGMEKDQFLRFRMALLPASGFQSAQYRMLEICSTTFNNIVSKDYREKFVGTITDSSIDEMFNYSYWKQGAVEAETGKKTLTLKQFEKKYTNQLIQLAKEYRTKNLSVKYHQLSDKDQNNPELKNQLRQLDVNININWPLSHYKSAVRYLQNTDDDVPATGGTNWQKYLPPRFQKRIFYPELWSDEEIENWGKAWVESIIGKK